MNQNDELYHYGVLGMKWGVRRYQNKDGSLITSGKKRVSSDTEDRNTDDKRYRLTDKQKKIIITGSIAAGACLAAYGGYKLSNSRDIDRVIKAGKIFYR